MNRDTVFYNYMTPEQQDLLNRSMQQASFRKGQIVHRHGDSCVGLIFVRKGRLAFSILSAACILRSLEFESQITAEVNTEVSILPAPTLSQLMNANHDVERLVYKQAVWQYSGVLRTLQQILFLSLEKRLATFLLDECRRRKAQSFSATHEQIARYIGSSREVVTRMLNQFADRGLVKLGRGSVTVLDPDGLEDILL